MSNIMSRFLIALIPALLLMLGGCSGAKAPPTNPAKMQISTSIPVLADWAQQVGGAHVQTWVLLPANSSPHVYEPTNSDMRRLSDSRLFLRVGLHLDPWAAKLAHSLSDRVATVALGDLLQARNALPSVDYVLSASRTIHAEEAHSHGHEGVNPHYWLDPGLAVESVQDIRETLSRLDPAHAADFTRNADAYTVQLKALDEELSKSLSAVRRRAFVSFHNAFPYLAHRYELRIGAVIEESPGSTPSERHVREVALVLRRLRLKTVFGEPQLNPRVAEILAREIGGRVDILDPYGSQHIPERDTYLEMMRYNGAKLREALKP